MNTFVWIKKNKLLTSLLLGGFLLLAILIFNIDIQQVKDEFYLKKSDPYFLAKWALGTVFVVGFLCFFRLQRLERKTNWLIDATNWNIKRLKSDQNRNTSLGAIDKNDIEPARWPWGDHHTETLSHLEAAARKWWVLYDPGDISTAPTNEMVIEWLQSERAISRDKARAIASMLRPDGLPTGPRR